jgi:SAM-dependent methyltransferase
MRRPLAANVSKSALSEMSSNLTIEPVPSYASAILRCLSCGRDGVLDVHNDVAQCRACSAVYPCAEGVPVLARDPQRLAREIEEARLVNPDWYVAQQPPEAASPWRHHLKKRRLYVEGVLARELSRRGKGRAKHLLDLGCGDGNHLVWLKRFAENLYGCDYNIVRLARARARVQDATLFLADILDFPAADGVFDVIFFNHVIEHMPDDAGALATVARLLAPGGLLVLGTPNEGAWWWQMAYRRAPEVRATTDHVHFYTAEILARKVRASGLDIIEIEHMGWGPPDWRLDGRIRKFKILDDLFEVLGRSLIPRQASSLYLIAQNANM